MSHADTVHQVTLSIVSDRVYHGLSESTENPGVALHLQVHGDRWFAGGVGEYSRADQKRERHQAVSAYIGVDHHFDQSDWLVSGTIRMRKFIDSNKEWDYWEFGTQLRSPNGFDLSIDYSPDYYAHNTSALVSQLRRFHEFDERWYAFGAIGFASLSRADDYKFGSLGAGYRLGRSTLELVYDHHDLTSSVRFRDPVDRSRIRINWSHRIK